jgi:hypothetical protein
VRALAFSLPAAVLAALTLATPAKADISSWLAVGGGYGLARNSATNFTDSAGTFSASIGVGTDPKSKFIFGGVFRSVTYVGLGTDIGLGARVCTGGFARGDWGLAFDLGVGYRYWGDGQIPIQPMLTFGAPWGLQLGVGANVFGLSDSQALGGFAVLEVDLLRLTIMRQGSTDKAWKIPLPAGGRLP